MALRIWLPLNGTLENLGCSDVIVENHGATVDTDGKIGSCYSFDGSNDYILGLPAVLNNDTEEWSFTCWFKPEISHTGCIFSNRTATNEKGIAIFYYGSKMYIDDGARWQFTPSITIEVGQWNNIAVTRNTSEKKFYVNGVFSNSTTTVGTPTSANATAFAIGMSQSGSTSVSNNQLNGKLNDVRVYDHCLSAAEVHEISQGLVLHYKLNGTHSGVGENLFRTTPSTYTPADYRSYTVNLTENLVKGDTYTFQAWDVDVSHTGKTESQIGFGLWWGGSSVMLFSISGTSYFTDGHADYICETFTAPNSTHANTENAWIAFYNSPTNKDGTRSMSIGKWKLEKGSIPTGYIESDLDTEIDTTRVADSSGYGHHGLILNTVEVNTDTPRYNSCLNLVSGNSMINCGRGGMVTDSITVNLWVKIATWGNPVSCTEGGGWNFENSNGLQFPVNLKDTGYKRANSDILPADLLNEWHMLTGVYDRINQKTRIYIDAELKKETDTESDALVNYHASNVIWLGAEATSSATSASNGMVGCVSDFRIYCTPLSDDDILSLYNTPAKIDKSGKIYSFSLKESDSVKISKKGVFALNNAIETQVQKAKINKEFVSANEFIER